MTTRLEPTGRRRAKFAFTLVEVVMAIAILALVMAGMIYGYVQSNYRSEWSAMSLDAQSFTVAAVEQVRAAQWAMNGGTVTNNQLTLLPSSYTRTNTMLIPSTGKLTNVITTVSITNLSVNPPLYQFGASCVWYFPGKTNAFTNTYITLRAQDR